MRATITPEEMQRLEQDFMAQTGTPGILLMEMAARAVTEAVRRYAPPGSAVLFLCGPGNNGGDGYAAARQWRMGGGKSLVWELGNQPKGDAAVNRALLCLQGVTPVAPERDLPAGVTCVVDALFGTGLTRPLSGEAERLAGLCAESGLPLVAVDIPSGLNGADGTGKAVFRATETVTFHRVKAGLLLGQGPAYTGRISVAEIGIPAAWGDMPGLQLLTDADARRLCPPRPALSHKGTFGRTVILAGSAGMAGAAALCARACMRMGAGLTQIACRESLVPVLQTLAPCATCIPLPETEGRLREAAAERLRQALRGADAAAAGCGLGQAGDVLPLLDVLSGAECPVVWDADALNLLAATDAPARKTGDLLTPHPGEAARLLGWDTARVTAEPLRALQALQARWGGAVLLKGAVSLMTDGARMAANANGSPALAKGGSGDVLTGVLAALLAQRRRLALDGLTVLQLGAYLHGEAGCRAAAELGSTAANAWEVADRLRWPGDAACPKNADGETSRG